MSKSSKATKPKSIKAPKRITNNTYNEQIKVRLGTVTDVKKDTSETNYSIDGVDYSSKLIIGKVSNAKFMKNAGTVLGILESKWGFLFAFINQIIVVISGIKETKANE